MNTELKLNNKRTILVGFAFFLICLFWQAYDSIIPLILTNKFGLAQTWSGVVMALDNVLALFLLPLFGAISDRCASKFGRRTPFIVIGTVVAVVAFISLSFIDNVQLTKVENVTPDKYEASLSIIYDANPEISKPEKATDGLSIGEAIADIFSGEMKQPLQQLYPDRDAFLSIEMSSEDYTNYVVPARSAYAWQQTVAGPSTLVFFVILLLVVLVSMGIFRSPAVALMPDVTPKPLRSKANAIINLMGTFGGICVLILGKVFGTGNAENAMMSYTGFFSVCGGLMLIALGIFVLTVRETKWAAEADKLSAEAGIDDSEPSQDGGRSLSRGEKKSLLLILASVALWFMGYNAVTSKYSVYASNVLEMDYNMTLLIAQAAAVVSYIPIGIISSKIGRKKAIMAGVVMLTAAFGFASFLRSDSSVIVMNILFALAGVAWATINVNSYPMVVELARGGNVGKYTGYYYTASMAAQVLTPILSGVLLDIRFTTLFPYATIFVALAFVTMLFVKHGDSRPDAKQTVLDAVGGAD